MEITAHPIYRIARQVQHGQLSPAAAEAQVIAGHFDRLTVNQSDDAAQFLRERDAELALTLARLNQAAANAMDDDLLKGYCAFTLGQIYKQQGQDAAALACFEAARICLESGRGAPAHLAQIRLNVAEIQERQNDFEAALQEYAHILNIAKKLPDVKLEADAYLGLGRVRFAQEKADRARRAFKRALAVSCSSGNRRGAETALGSLGQVYHFLGDLPEARDAYLRAIRISQETGHLAGLGRHLNHLGNVWLDLGNQTEAGACYQKALETAEQTGDQPARQKCLQNRGNLWCDEARRATAPEERTAYLHRAHDCYQAALHLAGSRHDERGAADLLLNLGNVYFERQEPAEARRSYKEALALARQHDLLDTEWRVHYAWGKLDDEQRQARQARAHYEKAIDIVERQRSSLHVESRIKFWQERSLLYKRMMLCCLSLNELWAALEFTERARARYLADLLSPDTLPTDDTQNMIRTVLQGLPERTAVVVFNVTEAGTAAFIAMSRPRETGQGSAAHGWRSAPDGHLQVKLQVKLIEEFNRHDLEQLLFAEPQADQPGGYLVEYYAHRREMKKWQPAFDKAGATLARLLLIPVHEELARWQIKHLIWMPNLGLSLLPLHACRLADEVQPYMLDHYEEITYAPSFDVLRHCRRTARKTMAESASLLAVANPTQDLPWAEFEVEQIAALFKTRILHRSANPATPETVLVEAPQQAVLHFACHGEFALSNPLQSCLKLAGGRPLQLGAILAHLKLPATQLAVLSACETGLVDPGDLADEYVGLPAGFLQAGAPSVVSSLWAVDDSSTALLMEEFYREILKGVPPGQALRAAQHALRTTVSRPFVEDRIQTLLADLEAKKAQLPRWSEIEESVAGQITKLRRQLADLRADEKSDPAGKPFAHPYYWAAFTVSGLA